MTLSTPSRGTKSGRPSVGPGGSEGTLQTPGPPAPSREWASRTLPSAQPPAGPPRILVVDSNLLTAEAIAVALTQLDFCVRFVAPATASQVRSLVPWRPDLALLDIDSVDGATCLESITVLHGASIQVAVVGGHAGEYLLGECVHAGATSVIAKSSSLEELVRLVTRLLAREVVLGDDDKRQLTEGYRKEARARRARLTPFDVLTHREKCVLAELMEGYAADLIAQHASVSVSTVRTQIKAVLQKLGVNSQLAAVGLARKAGWTLDARDDTVIALNAATPPADDAG